MAEKKEDGRLHTPKCRVAFASVFKPRAAEEGGKLQYSFTAIIPKTADLKAMRKAAFKCGQAAFGEKWKSRDGKWPEGFRSPFRNGAEKEDYDGFGENIIFITLSANADFPPTVFDKDRSRLDPLDPASTSIFYSGCYADALVRPYAYGMDPKKTKGNKGIAFGLLGVQKVADGEKLTGGGGATADDFEEIEDDANDSDNFDSDGDDEDPLS